MFFCTKQQILNYAEMNQEQLRTEVYQNIVDNMTNVDVGQIGRNVILPATHIGSPRQMHASFQDAMATVRKYGKPHLFITMRCNPTWKEIQEELYFGQKAEDRTDLTSRVFNSS